MLSGEDTNIRAIARDLKVVAFDFDGVFTDNAVWILEDGRELVRCSRSDGLGLARLRAAGLSLVVVSTETNPVVKARCAKLKIDCLQAQEDKVAALGGFCSAAGTGLSRAAFVGNDINDLAVLQAVALPIVVADAHPSVRGFARLVTSRPGGHGAVREICDALAEWRAGAN